MWRLPKNRQNLTFQISILLHTTNASFQCLSWLSGAFCCACLLLQHIIPCCLLHPGMRRAASCNVQCTAICDISIWDTQAKRSWKPASPFGCWIFATKRTLTTLNLVSGAVKMKLCRPPQQLCSESADCLVCSTPLKNMKGNNKLFYCFLQCLQTQFCPSKEEISQQCTEVSDWCRITRQQNTR